MSIQSEIDRISDNVDDALAAAAEMGASVPSTASSDELGTLIRAIPKVNVVQSTGDSTADVMSQAAVTNALDFYVNMTDTESLDPEYDMVLADKTYDEVLEAYNAGRSVYARYVITGNTSTIAYTLPLMINQDDQLLFVVFVGDAALVFMMGAGMGNYAVQMPYDIKENLGLNSHFGNTDNPHGVTAAQVGAPTVEEMNDALNSYLPKSGGTVSGTVTFSNSSTQPGQPGLKWKAVNSKTPYVGYCTGSTDATFIVGSLTGTTYQTGLAIGGSSGNLLWKGAKIATTNDIPAAVTVDSAMSNSSTNPVQNKVVNSALANKAPAYTYGTADLTAGSSSLATGVLYFVYE